MQYTDQSFWAPIRMRIDVKYEPHMPIEKRITPGSSPNGEFQKIKKPRHKITDSDSKTVIDMSAARFIFGVPVCTEVDMFSGWFQPTPDNLFLALIGHIWGAWDSISRWSNIYPCKVACLSFRTGQS